MHFMRAYSAICTCSGTGLPDWTLELLHAHRIDEARMALLSAIPFTNAMLRPLSPTNPANAPEAAQSPTWRYTVLYVLSCTCILCPYFLIVLLPYIPHHHVFAESSICQIYFWQVPDLRLPAYPELARRVAQRLQSAKLDVLDPGDEARSRCCAEIK